MAKTRSWVVKVRCAVDKEIVCDNCTQEQAAAEPFAHAIDEREIGQRDWETVSVVPNE